METKPQRFVLTLQPSKDETDPEGYRRLRMALKKLLRCWGLRCVRIDYPDFVAESKSQDATLIDQEVTDG
jgi:hypothetical protein